MVSSENETTTATSGADASKTPKSTFSAIATPVIQALSFALRNAHTRDFQRRKDSVVSTESSSIVTRLILMMTTLMMKKMMSITRMLKPPRLVSA